MTKDEVYSKIAESAHYGNLGLFVGSGFSKSVFENFYPVQPLSWIELLQKVCELNMLDWKDIDTSFKSCPEIASVIEKIISTQKGEDITQVDKMVKEQVCRLTSWYPNVDQRNNFTPLLSKLNPQWIITTNYDLILEGLLPENSNSLGPNESLVFSKHTIPIYHLHGIRTNPNTLILTNEDYITLFRPNEYRLQKLSLTINESTTLIIGYSVGDPNVLTALDWSKNVYQNNKSHYPNGVIQLVYTETPNDNVIETNNGMILLETNSIKDTLHYISHSIKKVERSYKKYQKEISFIKNQLIDADEESIDRFITDQDHRREFLVRISNSHIYLTETFLSFLTKVFDECWERSRPNGAFHAYWEMTSILLDIIIEITYDKMQPALFETIASNLDKASPYIGNGYGEGHSAYRLWRDRKKEIPEINKKELINYSEQYCCNKIARLLE